MIDTAIGQEQLEAWGTACIATSKGLVAEHGVICGQVTYFMLSWELEKASRLAPLCQ